MKFIFIIFLIGFVVYGCELFSTREPEIPDTGVGLFEQPVSPQIVYTNLELSLKTMNIENYLKCFADTSQGFSKFQFTPSAQALSNYPSFFIAWDINSERRYFQSLTSAVSVVSTPVINFQLLALPQQFPDSSIYSFEYKLNLNHTNPNADKIFEGNARMTIARNQVGQWAISNWLDTPSEKDSIQRSWSILKAQFYN